MIEWLKSDYELTVLSHGRAGHEGVVDIPLPAARSGGAHSVKRLVLLKLRLFMRQFWAKEMVGLAERLSRTRFDLIVSHDLSLLPLAVRVRNGAKILLDAREYYPRHFEDRFIWRFFFQDWNRYLCRQFLPECDKVITVSGGIAEEYEREYGVCPEVVMSLPAFLDLAPSETPRDAMRLIHHGNATPSRKIENMIRLMDFVDERFHLDLMLVPKSRGYFRYLQGEARKRPNVRVIRPVEYRDIIPFINEYDVGLYLLQPVNFNQRHALPNKLFEFIQARLAVGIGPSPAMKSIVDQYGCGIVSAEFSPESLARELNSLSPERIRRYKEKADEAARELNADRTRVQVKRIVAELIVGRGRGKAGRTLNGRDSCPEPGEHGDRRPK